MLCFDERKYEFQVSPTQVASPQTHQLHKHLFEAIGFCWESWASLCLSFSLSLCKPVFAKGWSQVLALRILSTSVFVTEQARLTSQWGSGLACLHSSCPQLQTAMFPTVFEGAGDGSHMPVLGMHMLLSELSPYHLAVLLKAYNAYREFLLTGSHSYIFLFIFFLKKTSETPEHLIQNQ